MDYQWYYPQASSGGGGENKTDLQTDTIEVTEEMNVARWDTDRIDSEELAWQVETFSNYNGEIKPVEIDTEVTVKKPVTLFSFTWLSRFKGFINITTWRKK